ncbi:CRE-CYL-1 protein [Caenorhabditis remanei]|uniref:CRE-CYL-1 protein n=1 Tax=Caenorhabditis remanei TaxID=31234 RepID=E3LPW5_CAERE|nr:CRE-CYL-1 protein [Caenorhabditis remanei]
MASIQEMRKLAEAKLQTMIRPIVRPKEQNGNGETKKEEEEKFESTYKQMENPEITPSSFGKRPIYSKVDINCDKWLMTLDEESRLKIDNPPSLVDGLSKELEAEIRYLGCELIQQGAILLKLPQTAAATGQILFQRYFYQKSFVRYHFEHAVQACLLLASKIEEEPRRPREVYNVFHRLERLHRLQQSGQEINKETTRGMKPPVIDTNYINTKQHMINSERRILATLGFVVHVKHPHRLIVAYGHTLGITQSRPDILQRSWNYMNDGLRTDIFMRYSPETIACACIFLAARTVEDPIALPSTPFHWFEAFDTSDRDVEAIALQLVGLYARKRFPNWPRIKAELDSLRNAKNAEKAAVKAKEIAEKLEKMAPDDDKIEVLNENINKKESPDRKSGERDRRVGGDRDKKEKDRRRKRSNERDGKADRRDRDRDRGERGDRGDRRKDDKRDRRKRTRSRSRDRKEKNRNRDVGRKYRKESSSPPRIRR